MCARQDLAHKGWGDVTDVDLDDMGRIWACVQETETVGSLLTQLDRVETGNPAPAEVTQRLAKQQRALAQAIQELAEVASAEGIEALASDTRQILDGIQAMAEA